jgi:hypothetical protein
LRLNQECTIWCAACVGACATAVRSVLLPPRSSGVRCCSPSLSWPPLPLVVATSTASGSPAVLPAAPAPGMLPLPPLPACWWWAPLRLLDLRTDALGEDVAPCCGPPLAPDTQPLMQARTLLLLV